MVPCRSYVRLGCYCVLSFAWLASSVVSYAKPGTCEAILDPRHILENSEIVLLGEMHGTREIPNFLAAAVCQALQRDRSVTVGLEIPREENPRLQAYLTSPGRGEDLAALLAGSFWQSPYKDGRSSEAMVQLIVALRGWRAGGDRLRVMPIDPVELPAPNSAAPGPAPSGAPRPRAAGETRDRAMAEGLAAAIRDAPDDLFLVLTGNVHNRLRPGTPWDPHFEPMGYLLARALPPEKRLVALDAHYPGGKASFCSGSLDAPSCKPTDLPKTWKVALPRPDDPPGVDLQRISDQVPYSGFFYFTAPLTPSGPAVPPPAAPTAAIAPNGPP